MSSCGVSKTTCLIAVPPIVPIRAFMSNGTVAVGCVDCDVLTVAVLFGWWIDFMSSGVLVDAVEAGKKSIAVVKAAMPACGGSGGGDLNVDIKNPPVSKEKEKGKEKKKDKKTKKEKDEEEDDIDTKPSRRLSKMSSNPNQKSNPPPHPIPSASYARNQAKPMRCMLSMNARNTRWYITNVSSVLVVLG